MQRLRRCVSVAVFCVAAGMAGGSLQAQATRADSAAILLEATRRLELEGEKAAARQLLNLIVRHFPGTPAAVEAERGLTASMSQENERSGRASLIAFNTLYGAWLGITVPAALGADSPEPYGAGLLLGAPTGFFLTKALVNRYPMSSGQATITGFGARWGTWQGIGWREVFDIGDRTIQECYPGSGCYTWEDESERAPFTAGIVGGLTGMMAGGLLAQKLKPTHGAATMVELGSLWGIWYGLAGAVLADVDDGDAVLTWAMMGGNAGLLASAVAARSWKIGVGRARIVSAAGLAGGVAGLGLDLLLKIDDENAAVLVPALTSAIGLVAGGFMTKTFDSGTSLSRSVTVRPALVNVQPGQWALGMPALEPAQMLFPDRLRGVRTGVGARISLFAAEF